MRRLTLPHTSTSGTPSGGPIGHRPQAWRPIVRGMTRGTRGRRVRLAVGGGDGRAGRCWPAAAATSCPRPPRRRSQHHVVDHRRPSTSTTVPVNGEVAVAFPVVACVEPGRVRHARSSRRRVGTRPSWWPRSRPRSSGRSPSTPTGSTPCSVRPDGPAPWWRPAPPGRATATTTTTTTGRGDRRPRWPRGPAHRPVGGHRPPTARPPWPSIRRTTRSRRPRAPRPPDPRGSSPPTPRRGRRPASTWSARSSPSRRGRHARRDARPPSRPASSPTP